MARRVTPRIAGLRPGTSPPPVRMPITPLLVLTFAMRLRIALSRNAEQKIILYECVFRKSQDGIRLSEWIDSNLQFGIYTSIFVPRRPRNLASQELSAGQAGPVTRLPSTKAPVIGRLTYVPPAIVTSGPVAGYALHLFPCRIPAAARTCGAWQMAAIGLLALEK